MGNEKRNPWIVTYNGHEVDLLEPRAADVDHIDIAHAESLINRFTGHTTEPWSVAQHSVVGSILAEVIYPEVKWLPHQFLFHDATETYVGDLSSPLKSVLPGYKEIENKHRKAIEEKFALSLGSYHEKLVDLRMLATERLLFLPETATQWTEQKPEFTFEEFTAAYLRNRPKVNYTRNDIKGFWSWMWTPWASWQAEEYFISRMESLGI